MTQGTPSTCKHLQERMGAKGCRATISDSPAQSMGVPPTVVTFPWLGPPKMAAHRAGATALSAALKKPVSPGP